ncbi:copper resistance CopC family protein [Nonomuraea sp. ZG12]|uniref:copper resistance CopC family protein n=1 Tax=Nonomuraea sp. ZG12 TaxID=3452207 RepID=UPI003F8C36EC
MKKSPFAAAAAILAALFVLATAAPALAHDALKSSDPAKGATVKALDEVKLEFTGNVRMPFVIVRGAGDVQHQAGKPDLDGPVVTQKLKGELSDGAYVIAYRVVSSDGHPIEGEVPFTVKGATPSPSQTAASTEATATEPASPAASPEDSPAQSPVQAPAEPVAAEGAATTTFPIWLLVIVGALVGIGVGFLLSARKKKP